MSRWRAVWLVARREILERGRSRAFIVSLGLTVAFILAGIFLPAILGGPDRASKLGIVGTPPATFDVTLDAAAAATDTKLATEAVADEASGESRIRDGSLDALLIVPADGSAPTYVVKQRKDELLGQVVAASLSAARVQDLLDRSGVDQAAFAAAQAPPAVRELQPADPGRDASFIFANVGVILLFISIFTFGTWVLTGVVEEKQSRVVEVVLATVQPRDLLVGKVLGIGLLGLAQLVIMVAVGLVAGTVAGRFTLPATTGATVFMLLLWFVLGYALYSTALGVLGALASRMEEASNASSPVSILASAAYVFALLVAARRPERNAGPDRDADSARRPDGRPAASRARRDRAVGDRPVGRPDRGHDLGAPRLRRPCLLGRGPADRRPHQAARRLAVRTAVGRRQGPRAYRCRAPMETARAGCETGDTRWRKTWMQLPSTLRVAIEAAPIAHVVTLGTDGAPQASLAWIGLEGDEVVIGTMFDQPKTRNLRRDPRILISFETGGPNAMGLNAYYVLHGRAIITEGGAPQLLQRLAYGYIGPAVVYPPFPNPPAGWVICMSVQRITDHGPASADA